MGRASDLAAEERAEIVLALLRREEPMSVFGGTISLPRARKG